MTVSDFDRLRIAQRYTDDYDLTRYLYKMGYGVPVAGENYDAANITISSGKVSLVTGYASNLTQPIIGQRPIVGNPINGHGTVLFDGTTDLVGTYSGSTNAFTTFLIVRPTAQQSTWSVMSTTGKNEIYQRHAAADLWGPQENAVNAKNGGQLIAGNVYVLAVVSRAANDIDVLTGAAINNYTDGTAYGGSGDLRGCAVDSGVVQPAKFEAAMIAHYAVAIPSAIYREAIARGAAWAGITL